MLKKGTRIELVDMIDDPNPVPHGTRGTVMFANRVESMGFTQYDVDWDNGRSLMLCVPPDSYKVVNDE